MKLFLKNLLFTLVVPGTVGGITPWLLGRGGVDAPFEPTWIHWLGAVTGWVLGGAIYGWCLWDFATFGRGTPAPIDAPKRLVVRGLYRYSRNPMYVGILLVISGWLARYPSATLAGYAAAVALGFHVWIRIYEEPALGRAFGTEYAAYRKDVRRWAGRPNRAGGDRR